jgi:hypothetical protein
MSADEPRPRWAPTKTVERAFVPVEVRDPGADAAAEANAREFHMGGCRARTDGEEGVRPVYVRIAADDRYAHGHGWVVVEEQGDGTGQYLNFDGLWRRTMFASFPTAAAAKAAYEIAARAELRGQAGPVGVDIEPGGGSRAPRPFKLT